jgi:hypothetical protein
VFFFYSPEEDLIQGFLMKKKDLSYPDPLISHNIDIRLLSNARFGDVFMPSIPCSL